MTDTCVISYGQGREKPDPQPFRKACADLGTDLRTALMMIYPEMFALEGGEESESEEGQEATVTVLAMFLLLIGTLVILLGMLLVVVGVVVIFMGIALIAIAAFLLVRRVLRHRE
ncbi:hypothetical protein ACIBVL_28585 [Streptomyces sp. NPDC049687]|uniref:hypothetical protein n=1 Tax=Streptomyces sp. NPDC049687 TaxID=3365596 RepID=UPI0037ACAF53